MNLSLFDFPEELTLVERLVASADHAEGLLAREVAAYIDLGGGKKMRPRILILTARELGYQPPGRQLDSQDPMLQSAAALEIVHTASLIHDDVVDHADARRGRPSVHKQFGQDVAILMADMLYARAFDLALQALGVATARRLCDVTRQMCESELFQIQKRDTILSEDDYYSIINRKTAGLFALCTEIGARLASVDDQRVQTAARMGEAIGMAYQITDDVLDYTAIDAAWGKPKGGDLAQGKQTLPLVAAWQRAGATDRRRLETLLGNGRDLEEVLAIIERYDGIAYAADRARQFQQQAFKLAHRLSDGPAAAHFEQLAEALLCRTF